MTFSQLGMPLSPTFQKLMEGGLLTQLAPKPVPQPVPLCFRMDLHSMCNHEPSTGSLYACSATTPGGIHHIDFVEDDNIHMLSWDDGLPESIVPFKLTPIASLTMAHQSPSVPLILWPEDDDSEIRVKTTTTPKGLIHMMMADRATCIVFSDDDLPPEGSNQTPPLYITVGCSGHRVSSVLLDNGSTLNVYLLAIVITLGYAPLDFVPLHRRPKHMIALRGRSWVL
ncbi:hypothetical protein CK203_109649 [Vitis vinifera]|uniref:Uncharacterized protein n=1 Tax=Vitis vinifera TaxID=29760 RepID=A0A438CEC9_VITVI|nr:hypothetical protein CK203_109649 [Vitis vinifera]